MDPLPNGNQTMYDPHAEGCLAGRQDNRQIDAENAWAAVREAQTDLNECRAELRQLEARVRDLTEKATAMSLAVYR